MRRFAHRGRVVMDQWTREQGGMSLEWVMTEQASEPHYDAGHGSCQRATQQASERNRTDSGLEAHPDATSRTGVTPKSQSGPRVRAAAAAAAVAAFNDTTLRFASKFGPSRHLSNLRKARTRRIVCCYYYY